MIKKPIKAICWDLDWTLIHFKINSVKARRKAIKVLVEFGIPKSKLSKNLPILENIEISKSIYKEHGYSKEKVRDIIKQVNEAIIEVEFEAALKATIIEGIDQVLEYVEKQKIKQAIFTYNTHNNAVVSLKTAGISKYFEVIAGRDDIKNLKPHPDHLKFICKQLNVDCDEILIIGDTGRDIEAAINIGAYSIALNTKIPKFIKRDLFSLAQKIIEPNEIPLGLIKSIEELL